MSARTGRWMLWDCRPIVCITCTTMYMVSDVEAVNSVASLQNKGHSLSITDKKSHSAFLPLTSVLLLQVHHQQGQVAVVGWQQGFDPALLTGLVLGSELVGPQSRLAPHQREGELLLGLAQLDGAALQNNHSCHVPVGRPVLVEEEVPLQHEPALLIGSLYLALWDNCAFCGLLSHGKTAHLLNFLHNCFGEISSLGKSNVTVFMKFTKKRSGFLLFLLFA